MNNSPANLRSPFLPPEVTATVTAGKAPDLKGFGLMDALYAIENAGYKCTYEGAGHVTAQSPAPGTALKKGETIKLTLK